jgi:hypothetical protein
VGGRGAVRAREIGAEFDLGLKSRNADLEELVEVVADNAQEAQPLEQRYFGIFGLGQYPAVEFELGEFPVEIELGIGSPDLARFVGGECGPLSRGLLRRERGCAVGRFRLGVYRFGNFLLPGLTGKRRRAAPDMPTGATSDLS